MIRDKHLEWVDLPVLVEGNWLPVGKEGGGVVRRASLEFIIRPDFPCSYSIYLHLEHPSTVQDWNFRAPKFFHCNSFICINISPGDLAHMPRCMSSGVSALGQSQLERAEAAALFMTIPPPPVM